MKKLTVIFLAVAILLSAAAHVPVRAADPPQLRSGYYGIDRNSGLLGQIVPGTDQATLISRILPTGQLQLDGGVSTGSVLTLSQDNAVTDQLSLVVFSDCSGDGVFSVSDMLMVKSVLLNQKQFTAAQAQAADVSGDNAVTITDFLQMKSKILGLTDFTYHGLANAEAENARILAVGQTCSFGPADGIVSSAVPSAVSEGTEHPEDTAAPSEDPTAPSEYPTAPSADPTVPSEDPTVPSEYPTAPSENPEKIVTIEGDAVVWEAGTVTAVRLGTALLTCNGESLLITVCSEGLQLSLASQPLFVGPGAKAQLLVTTNHPVSPGLMVYTVADTSIATVDAQGVISGVTTGTTQVTVTLPGGICANRDIRVIQLIDTLTLSQSSLKLKPGSSRQLSATAAPEGSPEKLVWTSSDPSVATVDANGTVTGVAYGTVTVSCTTEYGHVAASCTVKVCDLIQVALTFDDGPSSQYTNKLLDVLQKYDIDATFFLVGNRISSAASSLKRMAQEGHEIGYHTWAHTYFSNMSTDAIKSDLAKFQDAVLAASGKHATVYRAPGGGITKAALQAIDMPHIYWSVDTRDWETRNSTAVKNAIINGLKDGAIILLHDIHGTTYTGTVAALEYIFSNNLDVEFLTVTELLSRNGTAPQSGVTYYHG